MRIKKFTLTKAESSISAFKMPEGFVNDIYYPQEAKTISIYLIEIRTEANPSDLLIETSIKGDRKIIPVSLFKTKMVYINGVYCWNTESEDGLTFGVEDFKIMVDGLAAEFSIDFYYFTDQKKPYILFEGRDYPHLRH